MKKILIYPVLALLTIGYTKAGEKSELNKESITIDENLNEWVLVKEESGVKVYFMKVEEEGMCQIKIKFENTLSQEVKFYWSINKEDKTIIDAKQTIISANNSEIFIDYLTPIKFSSKDYFNEFIISISK